MEHPAKKNFKKILLHQKLRLEISGGPLGAKPAIQAHLGVENLEKLTFGQTSPKSDATVKEQHFNHKIEAIILT